VHLKDTKSKLKMKNDHDKKRYVKKSDIEVGDNVVVKDVSKKKSAPYVPKPMVVTRKHGSMVTAKRSDNSKVTRNVSFFKRVPISGYESESESDEEEDENDTNVPDTPAVRPDAAPPEPVMAQPEPTPRRKSVVPKPVTPRAERPQRSKKVPSRYKDFVIGK
jgi:signal peptidase I